MAGSTITPNCFITACPRCAELPNDSSADLLRDESIPASAWELVGMPNGVPSSTSSYPCHCAECGTHYLYECETGCMEYDAYLRRLRPTVEQLGPDRYAAVIENLESALDDPRERIQAYAAASVAAHRVRQGDVAGMARLCAHGSAKVRYEAVLMMLQSDSALDPFAELLLDRLGDENGHVRDVASYALSPKKPRGHALLTKMLPRLVRSIASRGIGYHERTLLRDGAKNNIDLSPLLAVIDKLIAAVTSADRAWEAKEAGELLRILPHDHASLGAVADGLSSAVPSTDAEEEVSALKTWISGQIE